MDENKKVDQPKDQKNDDGTIEIPKSQVKYWIFAIIFLFFAILIGKFVVEKSVPTSTKSEVTTSTLILQKK